VAETPTHPPLPPGGVGSPRGVVVALGESHRAWPSPLLHRSGSSRRWLFNFILGNRHIFFWAGSSGSDASPRVLSQEVTEVRQEVDVDREVAENQRREESLRRLLLKLTGTGTGGAPDRTGGGMAPGWL